MYNQTMLNFLRTGLSSFLTNPKGIAFEGEEDGEEIIFLMRRHPITTIPSVFLLLGMLFTPYILGWVFRTGGLDSFLVIPGRFQLVLLYFWYLLTFLFVYQTYLIWYFNVYIVTDKRIVDLDLTSILSRQVSETPIMNVQDVTYSMRGILATIFNFGTVSIQTAAERREFEFEFISHPAFVHDKISDLVTKTKHDTI